MLHFALIGAGTFGRHHLRLLSKTTKIRLKTVVTRSPHLEQAEPLPPTVRWTSDVTSVLADPEIDCVVVATPFATHYSIVRTALEHGKHVLVEKPLVASLEEAADLKARAEKSGRILMVGFQYLHNDHIRYMKKEWEQGSFGPLQEFRVEHFLSPEREDTDCFSDIAPHALSVFQHFFQPTELIRATGVLQRDAFHVAIRFDRGPLLSISAAWSGKEKVRTMTLVGEQGTAALDETKTTDRLAVERQGRLVYPPIIAREPLENQLKHFIRCVQNDEPPLADATFGYRITDWLIRISETIT